MSELQITSTDLQRIPDGLKSFEEKKAELTALAETAKTLNIPSIEDKESYLAIDLKRKELKAVRVQIEKQGKEMRDIITPISKLISSKEKELVSIVSVEEDRLSTIQKWYESEQERIKAEAEQRERERIQARIDSLRAFNCERDYVAIIGMTDEQYNQLLIDAEIEYKAEQKRIYDEKDAELLAKQQEEKRLADIAEANRIESERLEKIRLENEAAAAKIKEEQDKIAAEKKAIEDEKIRIENERIQAERLELARKEAAEKAIEDERKRVEQEARDKEQLELKQKQAAERKAARAPDKEKLLELADYIQAVVLPELKSDEAKAILNNARNILSELRDNIRIQANQL